jgi:hypothetical protein
MDEDREAEKMLQEQLEREAVEQRRAQVARDEDETLQHERRAEKARYLAERLGERVESEHAAESESAGDSESGQGGEPDRGAGADG